MHVCCLNFNKVSVSVLEVLVKLSLLTGVACFNAFVWGESRNSRLQNLASKTTVSCGLKHVQPIRRFLVFK